MMEEEHFDDVTIGLQLQQFMDEWYYRFLHSGMAYDVTRDQASIYAMDIFEAQGVPLSKEEKEEFSKLDDDTMIDAVVQKMPEDSRKAFGHLALQLQLVMSAASRVRSVLEEGCAEEIARSMEDGDNGVTCYILKQAITEAAAEVSEIKEIHQTWLDSMSKRLFRLSQAQKELDDNKRELDRTNIKLSGFGKEQNAKARGVLLSMAGGSDKVLTRSVFNCWVVWYRTYVAEKDIHERFQKQVEDTQRQLIELKQASVKNAREVLEQRHRGSDRALVAECLRVWSKELDSQKQERQLDEERARMKAKMTSLKLAQKGNAKQSMMRMTMGNDSSLLSFCLQEWVNVHQQERKERQFSEQTKAAEERMQKLLKGKAGQAQGVLSKMCGSNDATLLQTAFQVWIEDLRQQRRKEEMDEVLASKEARISKLNARVKANASSTSQRATFTEKENVLMQVFMNWSTEAKLERVVRHYAGHLDSKKHQMDAVQSMFKSFATELERGLGTTPRSTRKSNQQAGGGKAHREGGHAHAHQAQHAPPTPA